MKAVTSLLGLAALCACAPNYRLTRVDPTPRPAKAPERVEVYLEEPSRPYAVIALWQGTEESPLGGQFKQLRNKAVDHAAALGADGVIFSARYDSGLPVRFPSMTPGVAEVGSGEVTVFSEITRVEARMIVWR